MITLRWMSSVWSKWFKEESYILFILAWPVATTYLLHSLVPLTSLAFVGHVSRHKSKLLIDAIALGVSFINVAGYAVIFGLSSGTETLCSQAYGAKNYKRVGIILQRSILICSLALFPVVIIFLNVESILLILYQSPCVARLTGKFCKIMAIGLPAMYLEVVVVKYLQSQGVVKPTVFTALLSNITNITGLALLLYGAGMEIEGAAIVTASTSFVLLFSIMFYMYMRKPVNKTWHGISWESLKEWKEYLWLAIPGLFMVCGEWWTFDIGIFVTGNVNGEELAAYNITLNLVTSGFVVPFGIGIAVAVRVGNMLGAGNPDKAKKATMVALCFTILWCSLEMLFFLSYRSVGEVFTTDRDVIDTTGKLTYLGSVFVYSDGLQAILSGVLRGCGKQLTVAGINIFCYYLLGLPISLALVYAADFGAFGFWIGCTTASVIQVISLFILVFRTDFILESQKAQIKAGVSVKLPQTIVGSINNQLEQDNVASDNDDIEMTILINSKEQEEATSGSDDDNKESDASKTSSIKLLLLRTPWYIIGLVVLVVGLVLSQYRIQLPYEAECDDDLYFMLNNSSTLTTNTS